ncbi:MAG: flagellar motor switch protein FliG [Treponema sp.]|jgi:flagellar motor switch protein FliG|nr:flagellar motor switch protein FliG [Treponema sp.]
MGNMLQQGISAYQQTMHPKVPENAATEAKTPSEPKAQGLLKTTPVPVEDSKVRRVAKFLILVGSDQAAKILSELEPEQVEEISREIALIRGIDPEDAQAIFAEFKSLFALPVGYLGASSGGIEAARRILYAAYGPEKGEALLNKTVPDSKENIFGFLEEFSPEQVVFLLKDESPAMAALILARLPPKASADALMKFPAALKPEILKKIAHQSEVSPEVLERVAQGMRERARHLGSSSQDIAIDGKQALAAILKQGDYSLGDRIINELETESPDIGKDLRDKLYTLDDVVAVFNRPLAEKLKTMTDKEIAILLKGRSAEFREKILSNVSSVRKDLIREEGEILGAVPKRDCDTAANDFIAWFRKAREDGGLILSSDEDWVT